MRRHRLGVSKCVSLLMFVVTPAISSAAVLELSYPDYPASSFGCSFEATELGERLKATGIKVSTARCVRENKSTGTYSLAVTIERPSNYVLESTYRSGRNFYSNGWYKTQAECEATLDQQTRAFQINTGLEPFIAYCSTSGSSYSALPFWPRIEAIGKADLTLVVSKIGFSHVGKVDTQAVLKRIQTGVTPGHRNLVFSSASATEITLGFYTASEATVTATLLNRYKTLAECELDVDTVRSFYADANNNPIDFFCSDKNTSTSYPGMVMLGAANTGINVYSYYQYYSTRADCLKDLPTVIADVESYGDEVIGAVCGYYFGYYMPYLYSRN
jgi:hypothetical protein